jgi:hypothetical protein
MVGVRGEQLFQDGARLQQVGVGLVRGRHRLGEGERVEDRGLHVVGMARRHRRHRVAVGEYPRALVPAVGVTVQLGRGRDVPAFPLGLGAGPVGPLDRILAPPDLRRRLLPSREGIAPGAEGQAPVGDPAGRVRGPGGLEGLDGRCELERVEQRHRAIELRLRGRATGGGEADRAEVLGRPRPVLVLLARGCVRERQQAERRPRPDAKDWHERV